MDTKSRQEHGRSAAIESVIFDMGGVLMTFDGLAFARVFAENEDDARLLDAALFGRTEWALLDAGAISHQTMARVAAEHLPRRLRPNLDALIAGWPAHSRPIEETNRLALDLKTRGLGIYVLSNASTRIEEQLSRAPVHPALDGWMASAFEHIMKPDPDIYRLLAHRFGLDVATCLFVDDNADNCIGAEIAGMRAHHFTGDACALAETIDRLARPARSL
ncbi:HAD-superfamily hydrolase, subfamily IA, variant 3 [Coriobacterium glomerans PW2]|uniref:HAD-superfamily hydrolase, subfamily IA, variant 3 n=1 Tax=Coriobacterium glomerans (strain ATCC 49209 / DSM 20642 / JCM 10262 / PW2) TaxID=700015 RepID=F2N8T2_CORGP|nr:HAD family phosphatase [Coriobacterium glomerans]AEB07465.1 HAD-superfamily hydrolase, subfamily IA, variant 3 [Coriobacterium glomerans PW2]